MQNGEKKSQTSLLVEAAIQEPVTQRQKSFGKGTSIPGQIYTLGGMMHNSAGKSSVFHLNLLRKKANRQKYMQL